MTEKKKRSQSAIKAKSSSKSEIKSKQVQANLPEPIASIREEIQSLSYEEALKSLDFILDKLQKDSVPVNELQEYYLRGKLYFERCEFLLNQIEQEVLELKSDQLDAFLEE